MGWVNANLLPINSAQVTNDDIFENGAITSGGNLKEGIDWTTQIEQSFWQEHANTFVIGDSNNGIYVHIETGNYCLRLFHNGQEMVQDISLNWDWGPSSPYYGIFYAGYNDSTQKGSIGYLRRYYNFPDGEFPFDNVTGGSIKNNDIIYLILKNLDETGEGGGAGSGYIGNSLLSNKKMVGYNVPTSSATSTKTESVNDVSASAVSGKPKSGNGFARIKFLRDFEPPEEYRQYLDTINGTGFFFRDWPQVHNDDWNIDYYPHYPLYIHSYKSYGGSSDFNSGSPWIEETTKGIASLYITEQQTGWGYDTTFEAYDWVYWAVTPDKRTQVGIMNKTGQYITGRSGSSYGWDTDATHNRTDTTGHGYESLSALFYDITRLYRNVNIYVNGVLWSSALT